VLLLGDRRLSVFPVPCRTAVRAEAIRVARELNRGGVGPKPIRTKLGHMPEDSRGGRLLLGEPATGVEIREVHPEVCFWALAGRSPMKHNKGRKKGSTSDSCPSSI
jgi:predicted RNase H-like nuclease